MAEGLDRRWNEPILAPTEVKRQHYVPRMYLRTFTRGDELIQVWDLDDGRSFSTTLENVAVMGRYYDIEVDEVGTVSPEDWLASVESAAVPVIRKLVDAPTTVTDLAPVEENELARFLGAMAFRVPSFRSWNQKSMDGVLEKIKDMARGVLFNRLAPNQEIAEDIWAAWKEKPDHWWFGETEPFTPEMLTASMLSEVQGWANLIRSMNWTVGRVPSSTGLYTSDNPMAPWVDPVRLWWDKPAFANIDYFVPLSPSVLMLIQRRRGRGDTPRSFPGSRSTKHFSQWEASFARHVLSNTATRYLFGVEPVVSRDCATTCLERIEASKFIDAIRYHAFDPRPPKLDLPE